LGGGIGSGAACCVVWFGCLVLHACSCTHALTHSRTRVCTPSLLLLLKLLLLLLPQLPVRGRGRVPHRTARPGAAAVQGRPRRPGGGRQVEPTLPTLASSNNFQRQSCFFLLFFNQPPRFMHIPSKTRCSVA
jgi:hypothetical protein